MTFVVVGSTFCSNPLLSCEERGLLLFMVDQSPSFKFHYSWLSTKTLISKGKLGKIMKNLKELGYIEVIQNTENGKFTEKYIKLNRNKILYKSGT